MIKNLVQVNFRTHHVHISRDLDNDDIICFKYDGACCDFEVFSDQDEASDWIMEPLPLLTWCVTTSDE